jgi:16S rRNA A1518/A1519 N6-dimethyltransferase RsmA/KsgA/DIM1 with predicted DNA glycosylase/AP lyase activity
MCLWADIHTRASIALSQRETLRPTTRLLPSPDAPPPPQVHSAVVSLQIEDLEALIQRRQLVKDRLERALAKRRSTGREPTHRVAVGRCAWLRWVGEGA